MRGFKKREDDGGKVFIKPGLAGRGGRRHLSMAFSARWMQRRIAARTV